MTDQVLSGIAPLVRYGRFVSPTWTYGSEATAPAAGSTLVSVSVPSGRRGYIYGIFISAGEGNDFRINWTSGGTARSIRVSFAGRGTVLAVFNIPINEGLPADGGTSITITNVNAGSSGIVYQAGLLVGIE
jgi:hypothetical protein